MNKYIDANLLRKEIENRIKSSESCPFIEAEFGAEERIDGKIRGYNEILDLLDSFQQEQHEVDLEKEIDRWFSEKYMQNMEGLQIKPIVKMIAHYFFELGLNTQKGK